MRTLAKVLATFFGLGLAPVLPGTVASAAADTPLCLPFAGPERDLSTSCSSSFSSSSGWRSRRSHADELGRPDPGRIVIDEVCGQLIALAFLPPGWVPAGLAFALFRFFDIIKPWPIRRLERLPGGWGIMADDVGAGLAAAALTRLVLLVV